MKDLHFDSLIIAARPKDYGVDSIFTDKVMSTIRSSEILSSQIRKKSVNKKETLFMKFRHLPKFAVIAIAIGALLLVSGTAFAAYQLLWPKPHVEVSQPTISTSGRQEVGISFDQCGSETLASHYELKANATITIDDVPNVVKAHCELSAISDWADKTFPNDGLGGGRNFHDLSAAYDSTSIDTTMATHIITKDAQSITLEGLTKYNQTDTVLTPDAQTRYIAGSQDVSADQIRVGDVVVTATSNVVHHTPLKGCTKTSCSTSGKTISSSLVAVVKLDMPFQYYDQFAWQSLSEVDTCSGNPEDECMSGFISAIDLYTGGSSAANADLQKGIQMKEIQGVVTKLDGTTTVIRSSSGTLFTLKTSTDFIATYNQNKAAQYYNNQTVKVGSKLIVGYVESADEHSHTLDSAYLKSVQLQIEIVGKSDPAKAY